MFADREDPDRWVADGTDLDLRTRTLRAVHTPGHTLGHLVYHDAASEIMFAGDHVLPHITPSIGFEPAGNRMALRDLPQLAGPHARAARRPAAARPRPGHRQHPRAGERAARPPRRPAGRDARRGASGHATAVRGGQGDQSGQGGSASFDDLDLFSQVQAVNETAAHLEVPPGPRPGHPHYLAGQAPTSTSCRSASIDGKGHSDFDLGLARLMG